ncbi:MAG: ThiF family adenylyltransferase [Bacteroidota bacterium]|nr:ThiF family adenylyltransferase [Bacteroidota bacterium]
MSSGKSIEPEDVRIPKARGLVQILQSEVLPFVNLLKVTRQAGGRELVEVEVRPEVPTHPVNDIRFLERIEIAFDPEDQLQPRAFALRSDFPRVPHTYLVAEGKPLELCLFDAPYSEQRLRWTAAKYVRQLHFWLSKTATGTLHQADQQVELFLPGSPSHIILPNRLFESVRPSGPQLLELDVRPRNAPPGYTLIARRRDAESRNETNPTHIALVVDALPQTQGGLTHHPETLFQLQTFLESMEIDLLDILQHGIKNWLIKQSGDPTVTILVILRIPVRRSDQGTSELVEVRAFHIVGSAQELGRTLGCLDTVDGVIGAIVGETAADCRYQDVAVYPLNPVRDLTRQYAQIFSGTPGLPDPHILTIGAGALGSQVILNLARGGYGKWTVVDYDVLLPHNLVRHALPGAYVGAEKAGALAHFVSDLYEDGPTIDSLRADVLARPVADKLREKLDAADVSVDFSAAVAVARWLALDAPGDSRRISVFLNPDGTDLVVMAEGQARSMRLDQIEAQYYRAAIKQQDLTGHLLVKGERLRYGRTCRDVTSTLSQNSVSLHSGIAGQALKDRIASPEPCLAIWRTSENQSVWYHSVELTKPVEIHCGDWLISADEGVLRKLRDLRQRALLNETGGVLLGYPDHLHRMLYVVDALRSPPDSHEWPTSYVRGCDGLREAVDDIASRTAGVVGYMGEWHSHPEGASCELSSADLEFLTWLTDNMWLDGMPGLMAIVCEDGEVSWHTAPLPDSELPDDR